VLSQWRREYACEPSRSGRDQHVSYLAAIGSLEPDMATDAEGV